MTAQVRRSFHAPRSGDLHLVQDPYWLLHSTEEAEKMGGIHFAAIHDSPWNYDTFVPVLFAGPGIPHGVVSRRVSPKDSAPTLSAYVGVKYPSSGTGEPLVEVLDGLGEDR